MANSPVHKTLLSEYASLRQQYRKDDNSLTLLIADENTPESFLLALSAFDNLTVITNRFDISEACHSAGLNTVFCDFDFQTLVNGFDYILYRISKERSVCHHIFNEATKHLNPEGRLLIVGKKNEGVKGFQQILNKHLGLAGSLKKYKDTYIAALEASTTLSEKITLLDDKGYGKLRSISFPNGQTFYSKPGIYGWNKIDHGSKLLFDTLLQDVGRHRSHFKNVIDLGCGYGYLSVQVLLALQNLTFDGISILQATDNNAAAVKACTANLNHYKGDLNIGVKVTADDCGKNVDNTFNLLLCNPPFHQGFESNRVLTDKFLLSANRLLSRNGLAYFVVNVFVPLEKLALKYFKNIVTLENNGQFKVIRLSSVKINDRD